jgi:hypothetical protein
LRNGGITLALQLVANRFIFWSMNYVFGREFQELVQGSKTDPAYDGQAILAKWPISNPRLIRFSRQSSFWRPHWFLPKIEPFQERLGKNRAGDRGQCRRNQTGNL